MCLMHDCKAVLSSQVGELIFLQWKPVNIDTKGTCFKCLYCLGDCVKSSHLYSGRIASSALDWYQKGPFIKLGLHDKKFRIQKLLESYLQGV